MKNEKLPRIAIVNPDKCKPNKCGLECKRRCPVNINNKMCIEVDKTSKTALISESLCLGNKCGICVNSCPFNAIQMINLPKDLSKNLIHQYGPNSFRLHALPIPRPNQVLGLVGQNGTGKSTCLKILSGKLQPNLGNYDNKNSWMDVINHFKGSELQGYFVKLIEDKMKTLIKPQYVDQIKKLNNNTVMNILNLKNQKDNLNDLIQQLDLTDVLNKEITHLSGGELQRFAIAVTCIQTSDIYLFDEPSSFLDIKQRLKAAQAIRNLIDFKNNQYIIVVEHDLSILDYLSDYISILWGHPSAYGVVSMPYSVREGINIFLSGYLPSDNLRFRDTSISFNITDNIDKDIKEIKTYKRYTYPALTTTLGTFKLNVEGGQFTDSEIIVLLGENGCGKTSFIKILAGLLKVPNVDIPELKVSHKPQHINPRFNDTVKNLLYEKLGASWLHPQFQADVVKPLQINDILDHQVKTLSGGELQRVALILALGKPADIYLIDEPSAYLDSEQRIITARIIKRFILHAKKSAFVIEHDFIMATYLADRVIVYSGQPAIECTAHEPESVLTGMNRFLKQLDITFRRDTESYRPRINKYMSQMDQEQKSSGNYFHHDV